VKRKRFSVEQIVAILQQAEVGVPVVELCRQAGITEQTFYRWKKQYVGLEIDQVRQLKQLQEDTVNLNGEMLSGPAGAKQALANQKDHLSRDDPVADRIPDQVRHCMAVRP
jgi:putative transposase